jgi:hypothetical protein
MRSDLAIVPRIALRAVLTGATLLGLAACEQQQKPPPTQFGKNFEILPGHSGGSGPASQSGVSVDIPDPGDVALASKVRSALATEPALKTVTVDVVAVDGVVTLNGIADNHANSDRAARLALDVDGVRSVKNALVIARGS